MRARTQLGTLHSLSLPMYLPCNSPAERSCAVRQMGEPSRPGPRPVNLDAIFAKADANGEKLTKVIFCNMDGEAVCSYDNARRRAIGRSARPPFTRASTRS